MLGSMLFGDNLLAEAGAETEFDWIVVCKKNDTWDHIDKSNETTGECNGD